MKAHQIEAFVDVLASSGLGSPPDYHPKIRNEVALRKLLENLTETQVDYVLKFLPHYKIYHDYRPSIFDILEEVKKSYHGKIYFTPVIDANYPDKIKSGTHIFYDFKTLSDTFFSNDFHFIDSVGINTNLEKGSTLFAVDDFVGSGTQFLDMITALKKNAPNVTISGLCVPFIMKAGFDAVTAAGLAVICYEIRQKAIDVLLRQAGENVEELYTINDQIEQRINFHPIYARGFDKSEALISLKKTPDNTLPIFWERGDDNKWHAPFPR